MNRRKAIRNILLVAGVAGAGIGGYEWRRINKKPALDDLAQYKALLSELAETIIPATHTPGAKDARVGEFIYKMVIHCTGAREQNRFLYGLHDLEDYCHDKYGKSFMQCAVTQREETLLHFEQAGKRFKGIAGKVQRKIFGDGFFKILKTYTVMGYATSQKGATQGFAYDYIPGAWQASVPLRPGQRSWATK